MPVIKVILGSTRPDRFGHQPANWLMDLTKEHPEATYELVDLANIDLPFLDEPVPPSMVVNGEYAHEHTKKWAKIIGPADGFVFVTAEYNYGIPAALKNAIDFLGAEWRYKPVSFVGYGVGGGIRAVTALRVAVAQLNMYSLRDEINFVNYWAQLDKTGTLQPTEEQTAAAHKLLKNTAFWAEKMTAGRQELQATAAAK
jgi:NAD(P)H-dependent FMN reductase